jgi:predicted amidohydrolase
MFSGNRGAHKRTTVCPARAQDNAMYVVVANHSGPSGPYTGCGGSAVWAPAGVSLADAGSGDPGFASACLDPDVLARARAEDFVLMDPSLSAPVHPRDHVTLD